MKKHLILLSLLFLILCLTGCESEETRMQNIDQLIDKMTYRMSSDEVKNEKTTVSKYINDSHFLEKAKSTFTELCENKEYERIVYLVDHLQEYNFKSDNFHDHITETFISWGNETFSTNDPYQIVSFIKFVGKDFNRNRYGYAVNLNSFYGQMKAFIENTGIRIIAEDGQGGYYDDTTNRRINKKGAWYDPLSKKYLSRGEIGTYRHNVYYTYLGDLEKVRNEEEWWSNTGSNPETKSSYSYVYKGRWTLKESQANTLLKGSSYELKVDEDGSFLANINGDITIFTGDGTITIPEK